MKLMLKLLSYNYVNTRLLQVKMTILIDYVKKYIGDPTQSLSNYQNEADRHHNFCKLDNDFTSYCFPSKAGRLLGVWKVKCHPNCMIIPATTTATSKPSDIETRHRNIRHRNQTSKHPTSKPEQIKLPLKNENSGRSRSEGQHHSNDHINKQCNQVLNCEQTSVCDITINNPLREAFRVVIHPMAEVRFLESIRNGTHVSVDSIQPSSVWISPRSRKNRVSFLCLPGGIEKGSNHSNIIEIGGIKFYFFEIGPFLVD